MILFSRLFEALHLRFFYLFFFIYVSVICRFCIARKHPVLSDIYFSLPPCGDSTGQERHYPSAMPNIKECPPSPRVVRKYCSFFIISHQKCLYTGSFLNFFILFLFFNLCVLCIQACREPRGRHWVLLLEISWTVRGAPADHGIFHFHWLLARWR